MAWDWIGVMLSRGRIVTEEVEESEEEEPPMFSLGLVLLVEKVGVSVEVEEGHGVVLLCRCYNRKPETMMKMIYGAVRPDEGEIRWNGQAVHIRNPQEARNRLDKVMAGGKSFTTVEEVLLEIYKQGV